MSTNFGDAIRLKLANDPDLAHRVDDAAFDADIAEQIHDARTDRGMTQAQLARAANTSQSVISRLESADYQGHSLAMLRRIAAALGMRVRCEFYSRPSASRIASAGVNSHTVQVDEIKWNPPSIWNDIELPPPVASEA